MRTTEGEQPETETEQADQSEDSAPDSQIRNWWRAILVGLVVLGLIGLNTTYGAQAAGRAVVLGIIWFAIGGFRPNATRGYSGLWLYFLGLAFVVVPTGASGFAWGLGIVMATLVVGIVWTGRKVWVSGENRENYDAD